MGFHPEKILQAVRHQGASEAWLYVARGTTPAKEAKVRRCAAAVERGLRALRIPCRRLTLEDPFDYPALLYRFVEDLRRAGDRQILFNLTGGPKTMTVAATMACLLLGIPVVYVPEEEPNREPVVLPIVRLAYTRLLGSRTRRVLEALEGLGPILVADLARRLRMPRTTLEYHLAQLDRLGALDWIPQGRRRRVQISDVGRVLLLGLEGVATSRG